MKRSTTALLLFLFFSACGSRVAPEDPSCSCADGWRCCGDDVCVPEGQPCPDGSGPAADDDELIVSGEVCTSTAEDLLFPVKVVLVVDSSGSMMFSDPSTKNTTTVVDPQGTPIYDADARYTCLDNCEGAGTPEASCASICGTPTAPARQAAAAALVKKLQGNPSVSFAIVRFNSRITVNGVSTLPTHPGEFTSDSIKLAKAIDHLSQADLVADYQGALTQTRLLLEHDMKRQSRVDRSRTRYVVVFFSDGGAGPVCKPGCENDVMGNIGDLELYSLCDVPRDQWCYTNNIDNQQHCKDMTTWHPYLKEPCAEYNTDDMILDEVRSITKLEDLYGVGGLSVNITYLFDPTLPKAIQNVMKVQQSSDAACSTDKDCATGERCTQIPGLKQMRCKAPAERLLVEMARAGNGSFRRFSSSGKVDFLLFDYASLFRPFGITSLVVTNVNSRPGADGPTADSDGDGLSDAAELAAGPPTNPDAADSDGDGYGDAVEHLLRDQGDPGGPQTACPAADRVDLDGDGLNACEERALGTLADVADTDHDRIPDGMELVWGTDPSTIDDKVDLDLDGVFSGEEIRAHTDPRDADSKGHGYTYTVKQVPSKEGQCFGFTVRGVRLVGTRAAAGASSGGLNRILVYFGETPSDMPHDPGSFKAACIRARLLGGRKEPAQGRVALEPADFVSPSALLGDLNQARNDPGCRTSPPAASCADPCRGIPLP